MRGFLLFAQKIGFFLPAPSPQIKLRNWNFVCRLGTGHICMCFFGGFWLLKPIEPPYTHGIWLFALVYLCFHFVPHITRLQIKIESWNLECRFRKIINMLHEGARFFNHEPWLIFCIRIWHVDLARFYTCGLWWS